MSGWSSYGRWAPYVPIEQRQKQAAKLTEKLKKKGLNVCPVRINGRHIAKTFWGKAWCDNLEAYSDFSNRLPRGRTYVRNGSVIDLQITKGQIKAIVSGSSLYHISIDIVPLEKKRWNLVVEACSGKIDSLVELLQGKFSTGVMKHITSQKKGLFPSPQQISMNCTCPDDAIMCKHIAAALYGIGSRLDEQPELFFELRNVDHTELISAASSSAVTSKATARDDRARKTKKTLSKSTDLSTLFGIDLDAMGEDAKPEKPKSKAKSKTRKKQQ